MRHMQVKPKTLMFGGINVTFVGVKQVKSMLDIFAYNDGGQGYNSASIGDVPEAGYVYDLPLNISLAYEELEKLKLSNTFLNLNTRAIVFEFVVLSRAINVISSVKLTTEFTTAGLVVPSFYMRSVKFSSLEDGADDLVLFVFQFIMYGCFCVRMSTWIWSLCKMQPLIRAIEEHIKEETHIRLNESTSNYMKQSERRDSQKLNSGLGEKYENDSSDSDDNSDNNDKEMESKLAEEKMKKEFQYYSRASHSSSSRMCGKRVKRPIVVLTPNRQRHHWTTEEIHSPYEQDSEDLTGIMCRSKKGSCCFQFTRCWLRVLSVCHKCSSSTKEQIDDSLRKLNKPQPEVLPTLMLSKTDGLNTCQCLQLNGSSSRKNRKNRKNRASSSSSSNCCIKCLVVLNPCNHRVLSKGYGTFFTQSMMFDIILIVMYGLITFHHLVEVSQQDEWMNGLVQKQFNPAYHRWIRNNGWRVNYIGALASITLLEWLVWLSKLSRTFSVLFMIVEDMFLRLIQFLVFIVTIVACFGIFRYVMFGMEIGTYGLIDYLVSPFKELNGESTVAADNLDRTNMRIMQFLDLGFIFIMVLLVANLLIAFMADAYGDMMQTGNARYAYNQFEAIKLARFAGHSGMAPLGVVDEEHPLGKIVNDSGSNALRRKKILGNASMRGLLEVDAEKHHKHPKKCCTFAVMRGFQF